jgi:hypothetical protein
MNIVQTQLISQVVNEFDYAMEDHLAVADELLESHGDVKENRVALAVCREPDHGAGILELERKSNEMPDRSMARQPAKRLPRTLQDGQLRQMNLTERGDTAILFQEVPYFRALDVCMAESAIQLVLDCYKDMECRRSIMLATLSVFDPALVMCQGCHADNRENAPDRLIPGWQFIFIDSSYQISELEQNHDQRGD